MKKFQVNIYYHTVVTKEVEAETEEEAIELARQQSACNDKDTLDQIFGNMVEDATPDAVETTPELILYKGDEIVKNGKLDVVATFNGHTYHTYTVDMAKEWLDKQNNRL